MPFTNLVEVTSGVEKGIYTVNGIIYTRHEKVDSRYSKMDPIVCFTPNTVSAIPSVLPTSAPTLKTVAFIQAIQVQLNLIPLRIFIFIFNVFIIVSGNVPVFKFLTCILVFIP